jgi:hypothetical protein
MTDKETKFMFDLEWSMLLYMQVVAIDCEESKDAGIRLGEVEYIRDKFKQIFWV